MPCRNRTRSAEFEPDMQGNLGTSLLLTINVHGQRKAANLILAVSYTHLTLPTTYTV